MPRDREEPHHAPRHPGAPGAGVVVSRKAGWSLGRIEVCIDERADGGCGKARTASVVEEVRGEKGDFIGDVEFARWAYEVLEAGDEGYRAAEEGDEAGNRLGNVAEEETLEAV